MFILRKQRNECGSVRNLLALYRLNDCQLTAIEPTKCIMNESFTSKVIARRLSIVDVSAINMIISLSFSFGCFQLVFNQLGNL